MEFKAESIRIENIVTNIIKHYMLCSLEMVNRVIKVCPSKLWAENGPSSSIRNRIIHIIESVDYWLAGEDYNFKQYTTNGNRPELNDKLPEIFTKKNTQKYFTHVANNVMEILKKMNDQNIMKRNSTHSKVTNLQLYIGQIRHIQLNIGYCNEFFTSKGLKSVQWIEAIELAQDFMIQ